MNAAALSLPSTRRVESTLLGPLEIPSSEVLEFANGLVGLPDYREYVLVRAGRNGFFWLQSADEPSLAFLAVDPFPFFPGYSVQLAPADEAELELRHEDDVLVLAIVLLAQGPDAPSTVNLQAPLALNLANARAKQLVLSDPEVGTRRPLPESALASG